MNFAEIEKTWQSAENRAACALATPVSCGSMFRFALAVDCALTVG